MDFLPPTNLLGINPTPTFSKSGESPSSRFTVDIERPASIQNPPGKVYFNNRYLEKGNVPPKFNQKGKYSTPHNALNKNYNRFSAYNKPQNPPTYQYSQNTVPEPLMCRRRLVLDTPFSNRSTISYGLIVYAKDTKRWALTQRKHSVEFLLFIRGLYRLTHLPLLLSCITMEEAGIIHRCLKGGPSELKNIFLKELDFDPGWLKYALTRMAESRHIVINLLAKLDLSKNQLTWTWPKGRLQVSSDRETPFACAKREFTEEVELELPAPLFISDTYLSETMHTITGRNIESRYWIYVIPNEIPMTPPNGHPEVSNRKWVDTETCAKTLQSDYLFKQIVNIVTNTEEPKHSDTPAP